MEESTEFTAFVIDDSEYPTRLTKKFMRRTPYAKPDPRRILAFIPGVIQDIIVQPGQRVKWGDSLLILEAMKMRNDVTAPHDGTIKAVHVKKNERVMKNQLLIEFD
ncbi:MAG: acetyl-CoA carboxylase biotin carboxyl carrier protein subunit [Bacteroidota bacterium]|jgi:biotin carboxyl carrier protein|nr:acetyl-CoA carboxylase biotin carboxyl carrier protein subunit [Bacteroidota bacterium]